MKRHRPSSIIRKAAYHPDTQTLIVRFTTGATYSYRPVKEQTYFDMMAAPSRGAYFYQHIRNNKHLTVERIEQ